MFDKLTDRLNVTGYLVAESALRIGTERLAVPVGTEHPVLRDILGNPYIPGSSLKGVLRAYLESWVRGKISPGRVSLPHIRHIVCDPTGDDEAWCISNMEMQNLKNSRELDDTTFSKQVWDRSCLLCRTFGSPWLASHVRIEDAVVAEEWWMGQFESRNGVAIDRDKGTAGAGLLYEYEVVPAGTTFVLHLIAENLEPWQKGLLWIGLRTLARGEIALGGLSGRGIGWVKLEALEVKHVNQTQMLEHLIGKTSGDILDNINAPIAQGWVQALQTKIQAYVAKMAEVVYA